MTQAFILVDYSYDFVATDGKLTCGAPAQAIESAIYQKWQTYSSKKLPIFVMMDLHHDNDAFHPETKLFPPHNIEGTDGRKLFGKIHDLYSVEQNEPHVFWLDKLRYSSFCGTPLHQLLQERGITEIEIAGVCTDICVLHTAIDAYNLGYKVTVDENCVASFDQTGHEYALKHFKNVLGMAVDTHS